MQRKITLINPPWYFEEELEAFSQNLGLGYIAARLEARGVKVKIIDALVKGRQHRVRLRQGGQPYVRIGLPYDEIARCIDPDSNYIGITAPFTNHQRIVAELSRVIKNRYSDIPLIIGGVYPSTLPEHALTNTSADFIVKGEGELPLLSLIEGQPPANIPGLWFRRGGEIVEGGQSQPIEDLDTIPFPARHLLPMEHYLKLSPRGRKHERTASIITSRGCPFRCNFCSVHPVCGYKFRARSVENVTAEITALIDNYHIEHIEFEDDNFTLDRERARALFQEMIERRMPITWSTPNGIRIDALDRELVTRMKESGCEILWLAVESGDPELLKKMNKKLDLNKVLGIAEICTSVGITTGVFFLIGYPGETLESFNRTIAFARTLKKLGVRYFNFFIINAYPGTELFDYCRENNYLTPEAARTVFLLNKVVTVETEDFDRKEVFRRYRYARRKFLPFRVKLIAFFLTEKNVEGFYLRYWAIKKNLARLLRKIISI